MSSTRSATAPAPARARAELGLSVAGGVLMVVAFALDWSTDGSVSGDNPFHYPWTGGIAWLVIVATGVLAAVRALRIADVSVASPIVVFAATCVATVLMLVQVVVGGRTIEVGGSPVELGRGPGMWLALVAAATATTGAAIATWTDR